MEATITNCKNCGHEFSGRYCSYCGEKVYTDHDKSVFHFFEESLHFITHFEGTFFNTIRVLFSHPGKLSLDYCDGIRKRYFKPLSFFLMLVVIYLLFPVFEGLNMKLYYHIHHSAYGPYAYEKVEKLKAASHFTEAQITELFQHKSEKLSKFLLLLIIPFTALFTWSVTFRKRKLFFDQMVFASELCSVFLLWGFMVLPLFTTIYSLIYHKINHHYPLLTDNVIGSVMYIVLSVYVTIAAIRFYGLKRKYAILFTLLFLVAFYIIVNWLYKFLLFAAVINQIH